MKAFIRNLIRYGNAVTIYLRKHIFHIPETPSKNLIIGMLFLYPFIIGLNFIAWIIGASYLFLLSIYSFEGIRYLLLLYILATLIYSLTPLAGFKYVWNNWYKNKKLDPDAIAYYKMIGSAYMKISILMPALFLSLVTTWFLTKFLYRINNKKYIATQKAIMPPYDRT
ncbi:MAG TPA: hypothetical protein VFW42_11565 [Fluviicoccus sp.]|nr:hypothetical protein [Fluviicoccus sp.]